MGIIRRLLTSGEHIGHASEDEARAYFAAKAQGGNVGVVTTPEGQQVTLHDEVTDEHVEDAVRAHTDNAGQKYQGPPREETQPEPAPLTAPQETSAVAEDERQQEQQQP